MTALAYGSLNGPKEDEGSIAMQLAATQRKREATTKESLFSMVLFAAALNEKAQRVLREHTGAVNPKLPIGALRSLYG